MEKEYFTFYKMWTKRSQRYGGFREFNDHNFMKVFERVLNTHNKEICTVEKYMFHCIRSSFHREFKRKLDIENYSEIDNVTDNGLCTNMIEQKILIKEIISILKNKVKPNKLNMFLDRHIHGLDVSTIASKYKITRQSVNRNISSVVDKIRKEGI